MFIFSYRSVAPGGSGFLWNSYTCVSILPLHEKPGSEQRQPISMKGKAAQETVEDWLPPMICRREHSYQQIALSYMMAPRTTCTVSGYGEHSHPRHLSPYLRFIDYGEEVLHVMHDQMNPDRPRRLSGRFRDSIRMAHCPGKRPTFYH